MVVISCFLSFWGVEDQFLKLIVSIIRDATIMKKFSIFLIHIAIFGKHGNDAPSSHLAVRDERVVRDQRYAVHASKTWKKHKTET